MNKSVWHGYIISNGQFNWVVFLFCVWRERVLIIIGISVVCSLVMAVAPYFSNHLSLSDPLPLAPTTTLNSSRDYCFAYYILVVENKES